MQFEFPSFDLDHNPTVDADMDDADVADQRQLLQVAGLSEGLGFRVEGCLGFWGVFG